MLPVLEDAQYEKQIEELLGPIQQAVCLKAVIVAAFTFGLGIAALVVEEVLSRRGNACGTREVCPECGIGFESKGLVPRSMNTLIGRVRWTRRVWRCPQGCKIGQIAPLDDELGIEPQQRTSLELKQAACVLAVFVPFGLASVIFKSLFGLPVSPAAIWEWVQSAGQEAMTRLEQDLALLEERLPKTEDGAASLLDLPLLIGGDGVMVPFRPYEGSARGKTIWREVKVGIVARLNHRVTSTGKTVSRLLRRRVVAVLGDMDAFQARIWLTAVKEGVLHSAVVVWLSDGGRGFWRVFDETFAFYGCGVLDFYHASQHLWKAAKGWLDGRTTQARTWFDSARHRLRHGQTGEVIDELRQGSLSPTLSTSVQKTLHNVVAYLETHQDHIDYEGYKALGLPIGSGIVESTCKWLIQQRFKCVGMRWSEDGFNHLLHVRLAWVNGTFDDLFETVSSPKR